MKLYYFRGPNFGDELNETLMPLVFPDFFDSDESTIFLGIGSVVEFDHPAQARKIVFGSGFGHYGRAPEIDDRTWKIYGVRGKRTAAALGISPGLVTGDAAILISKFRKRDPAPCQKFSFMPHWRSFRFGIWERLAGELGLNFVDPRWPVETVLREIESSVVVMAEAMHGAIVADALRVPWIALSPVNPAHRFKWHDWAEALEIRLQPRRLAPSSSMEAFTSGPLRSRWLRGGVKRAGTSGLLNAPFAAAARQSLRHAMRAEPQLSTDAALGRAVDRLETAALNIKRDFG
jgi:succinoglycan biosynthesis protein ExoV